jgi:hypothetical protein
MSILDDRGTAEDEKKAQNGKAFFENAVGRLKLAREIYTSEPISIRMFGDDRIRAIHSDFTSGHRLVPWVAKKSFGAALIDISNERSVHFTDSGRSYQLCRRKVRKAVSKGYSFRAFDPLDHVTEILEINGSAPFRQGRPIAENYLDEQQVRQVASQEMLSFGVFDRDSILRAYTHAPILGEAFAFSRIIGHSKFHEDGIMYLLIQQTLIAMRQRYVRDGFPRWAYYDMFLGAPPGLRHFKFVLGFKPCRVRWEWVDTNGGGEC